MVSCRSPSSAAVADPPLPFGTENLDPKVVHDNASGRVRCYVRGCRNLLRVPARGVRGDLCPDHGIRCHGSTTAATYTYGAADRNLIVGVCEFRERLLGHPFKVETHRFGYEKSEDALTWNVFRSLFEAGRLGDMVKALTGEPSPIEPRLYLWGLQITDDCFEPWDLLIDARNRFESNLRVDHPKTEPDIAIHLPGRYLILIEAKFTSPNTVYKVFLRPSYSPATGERQLEFAPSHRSSSRVLGLAACRFTDAALSAGPCRRLRLRAAVRPTDAS